MTTIFNKTEFGESEVWVNDDGSIAGFSIPLPPIKFGETIEEKKQREEKERRMFWRIT